MAHNNPTRGHSLYQNVYCRSSDLSRDNGFPDLDLCNFINATKHVAHCYLIRLTMSDNNSELLSRGLQVRMDDQGEHNPVVKVCLGYAGAVGIIVLDAVVSINDRVIKYAVQSV